MDFVDVDHRHDLPPAPPGRRYLDFLGGTRQLRCYLVPEAMTRARFLGERADLDPCHDPIYASGGIMVRQDSSYALPGFYIVSLDSQFRSLDDMDLGRHLRVAAVLYDVRVGMRERLSVHHVHLHYEEKADSSCNVHYWLMPVPSAAGDRSTNLTRLDIKRYLNEFRFQEHRATILAFNDRMREFLARRGVAERDRLLMRNLAGLG